MVLWKNTTCHLKPAQPTPKQKQEVNTTEQRKRQNVCNSKHVIVINVVDVINVINVIGVISLSQKTGSVGSPCDSSPSLDFSYSYPASQRLQHEQRQPNGASTITTVQQATVAQGTNASKASLSSSVVEKSLLTTWQSLKYDGLAHQVLMQSGSNI